MNLHESCYLQLYEHVYEEIHRKNVAQIKLSRWWRFISTYNNDMMNVAIVRTCKSDDSYSYTLSSIFYANQMTLSITCIDLEQELSITFDNNRLIKMYLLRMILHAQHSFKIQIQEAMGYIMFRTVFQIFEL